MVQLHLMTSGMEPEVRRYLWKIVYSICYGLMWMIVNATLGIYFQLGFINEDFNWPNILFYVWLILSLGLLLWYYYRTWKDDFK